jgi:hypothetical protein
MLCALLKIAVAEDLQVDQAQADDATPEKKQSAEDVDAVIGAAAGGCRHCRSLDKCGGKMCSRQKLKLSCHGPLRIQIHVQIRERHLSPAFLREVRARQAQGLSRRDHRDRRRACQHWPHCAFRQSRIHSYDLARFWRLQAHVAGYLINAMRIAE